MKIQCPNCKGYKTNTDRATALTLGVCFTVFGLLFSGLVFPLVFAAVGMPMIVIAAFQKAKRFTCQTCGYNAQI